MIIYYNGSISPYKSGQRWERVLPTNSDTFVCKLNVGNYTEYQIASSHDIYTFKGRESKLFLGIERVGCFSFPTSNFIHPNYVMEKLNLEGDAGNIADWLNAQLGIDAEEFGRYEDDLCVDRKDEEAEERKEIRELLKDILNS